MSVSPVNPTGYITGVLTGAGKFMVLPKVLSLISTHRLQVYLTISSLLKILTWYSVWVVSD